MPSRAKPTKRRALPAALLAALAACVSSWAAAALPAPGASIRLEVDATRAPLGIFHSHLVLPTPAGSRGGELVLTYPKWIPGEHAPSGPIMQVVGLRFAAGGKPIPWRRDPVEMFAFHLTVPAGASEIEADFDYLSPSESFGSGYGEGPNATANLLVLLWNHQVLAPRGAANDALVYQPSIVLPAGWEFDSALEVARRDGDRVEFAPLSLTALVDSPLFAGAHFRTFPIVGGEAPVRMSVVADDPADLAVPQARLAQLGSVVDEAQALFGARHYRRYAWLVALTDAIEPNGLEHPESSDNRMPAKLWSDDALALAELRILPHEYVHSWNGKYRRPRGLSPGNYEQPLLGGELWIYEGLTRYLGDVVLAARAGIRAPEDTRDYLAWMASQLGDARPGRRWRPLGDTATGVQIGLAGPGAGSAMRRSLDYYEEGALVWLEADAKIRELTAGRRSLDDFCAAFFGASAGAPGGAPALAPYDLADIFATLGRIAPFDWRGFFAERIDQVRPEPPLGGLESAGWTLRYSAEPNSFMSGREKSRHQIDWSHALGLRTDDDGELLEVVHDSPAFAAGLVPGTKIVGVDDTPWSPEALARALDDAARARRPLVLLVERQKRLSTARLDVVRGAVYPHLERLSEKPDRLAEILTPRTKR